MEAHLRGQGLFDARAYRSYALTVLTSTHCNLGCAYCFQNIELDPTGGSRPRRIGYTRLTSDTITSVLDFTGRRMAEAHLDQLVITLMGGEPLLNPEGCRELLARASAYGLRSASMISNGVLLTTAQATALADLGLGAIQVTLDGDRDDHDRIRSRRSDGGGTFDVIVDNVAAAMRATSIGFTIRVNVSHHNAAGMPTLVERLAEALDPPRCTLYFALVGDVGIGYRNGLFASAEPAQQFTQWYRRALDLGFEVPRPRARVPCPACSFENGRYGAVVSADGTLSSCWDTAGKPEWAVGTLRDGYLPPELTKDKWVSCDDLNDYGGDPSAFASLRDTVDAWLLDQLTTAGRL
ncbi:radical SAM protein [Polymorphospora sp. NPDC050346]|uniref:radical SAM protein n=1 Tax=Polymorphospora sp. NPDC050346 TaxID=3155780 RepID=UPI0033EEE246